jgi:hypothetical protein
METSQGQKEKRKYNRLSIKDLTFAVSDRFLCGVATVVDISKSGVSFQYAKAPSDDSDLLNRHITLDLFKSKPTQSVIGIEGNVVYDQAAPLHATLSGTYQWRRCGVEFDQLAENQHRELDFFIKGLSFHASDSGSEQ